MTRSLLIVALALTVAASAAEKKSRTPNLSGRWEINVGMSDYGKMFVPKRFTEIIEHKEPNLTIDRTSLAGSGEKKMFMRLTTDGKEVPGETGGEAFKTQTRWAAGKLVTIISDNKGLKMTEVRSLSLDGQTQTVVTEIEGARGGLHMVRVMEKVNRYH